MAWVVDTCIILDLVVPASTWRMLSATCLWRLAGDGLCVCPDTFAEIGPAFAGDAIAAEAFLKSVSTGCREPWADADTLRAHRLWHEYQLRRRTSLVPKRPVADVLIAAFAGRFQGLVTRNSNDFRQIDPSLTLVEP